MRVTKGIPSLTTIVSISIINSFWWHRQAVRQKPAKLPSSVRFRVPPSFKEHPMTTAKELIFEEQARGKLHEGIEKLSDVIAITLGPTGRYVGLDAQWGAPSITNDGYSIVCELELKDQFLNMGASIVKEAAGKMKDKCGDGTTTTILLLHALVKQGIKNLTSGAAPIGIKRGMEKALEAIVQELSKMALPIQDEHATRNVAIIAASGSEEVGDLIAEAIHKAGKTGVITIEEGKTTETSLETVDGMQLDRGYLSGYFVTDGEQQTCLMHGAKVLITDKQIQSIQEILPILEIVAKTGQELLIIADDLATDLLSTLVVNKLRGTLKVCAIKAPGFGDQRKAVLADIAILTGGTVISDETGMVLSEAEIDVLGEADKIVINKEKTLIVGGRGSAEQLEGRIAQLEAEIEESTTSYDKEKLEERRAKLAGGVTQIRVGGATEPEMRQKKQLFEDSLNSTRAALEEGIVPGGGVALLRASKAVRKLDLSGDELTGAEIVCKACEAPLRQIVANSGYDPSTILEQIISKEVPFGFNAKTEKVEDLLAAGVIDACKIVASGLTIAVGAAGMVLLTEVLMGNSD
jgi:chaperonin GroEL